MIQEDQYSMEQVMGSYVALITVLHFHEGKQSFYFTRSSSRGHSSESNILRMT